MEDRDRDDDRPGLRQHAPTTSVRNGPAPSIAAASSISVGIVMKYWRMRNTS